MDGLERLVRRSKGGAARRHEEIMMMSLTERKERAADILAYGVARLLRGEPPRNAQERPVDTQRRARPQTPGVDRLRLVGDGGRQRQQAR